MMRLTIAIPTYNRPEALRRTVEILLPQLTASVEILVLDNASEPPAAAALDGLPTPAAPGALVLVRHAINIGGDANILRCLESSRGDWVWTLGDDDTPAPDAVAQILAAIAARSDASYFNFCTSLKPSRQEFEIGSLDEFLDRCDSFGNTLFISAGVFRREHWTGYLQSAVRYLHTSAPQFVLLLLGLLDGRRLVYSSRFTVGWQVAPGDRRWPEYLFFQFLEVVELLSTHAAQRKMWRLVAAESGPAAPFRMLRWAFFAQVHNPENPAALYFFARGAALRASLAAGFWERQHWRAAAIAASILHRRQAAVWRCWSGWHRLRHGRPLRPVAGVPGYRGLLTHARLSSGRD